MQVTRPDPIDSCSGLARRQRVGRSFYFQAHHCLTACCNGNWIPAWWAHRYGAPAKRRTDMKGGVGGAWENNRCGLISPLWTRAPPPVGCTGSTIIACWRRSGISRQQKLRQTIGSHSPRTNGRRLELKRNGLHGNRGGSASGGAAALRFSELAFSTGSLAVQPQRTKIQRPNLAIDTDDSWATGSSLHLSEGAGGNRSIGFECREQFSGCSFHTPRGCGLHP